LLPEERQGAWSTAVRGAGQDPVTGQLLVRRSAGCTGRPRRS